MRYKLFLLGLLVLVPIVFSSAQTAQELRDKINQKSTDITKLEQEIKQYQNQLTELGKQKSSLSNSIKELDLTRKKLVADISVTESKITKTNLRIQELSLDISNKEERIAIYSSSIAEQIKKTNELELESFILQILSENEMTSAWNDLDNMITLRTKIRETIIQLKQIKTELEDTRQETADARNELVALKNKLADQKKIVEQNATEKKKLLAETKNSEANYQKLMKEKIAKKEAFEKELDEYEAQLKYVLDPSKLPGKGSLSWPVDSVRITSYFGSRILRGVANFHKGVDLGVPVGTPVKSMADGTIAGFGNTDLQCPGVSYGKFILVKYNNGLASTYGHLSLIKVKKGDSVQRGQIIGYSGNTGSSTGPHLHISVYPKDAVKIETLPRCAGKLITQPIAALSAYLNPLNYLPK